MIDIERSLLSTIEDKIDRMRFLGENNPRVMKQLIKLRILSALYDWSDYLDQPQSIQKKLQSLINDLVLCGNMFIIHRTDDTYIYTNVNTQQTNQTWSRVWDRPEMILIDNSKVVPIHGKTEVHSFTPDPTCPISITYYNGEQDPIKADEFGKPVVDLNSLTTCEKMNIYINRETGQMFYLDPEKCTWETVKGDMAKGVNWADITDKPEIYNGIELSIDTNSLSVTLNQSNTQTSSVGAMSATDAANLL